MATLMLTQDAAEAIRRLTEVPIADGVRIFLAPASHNGRGPTLQVELAPAPDVNDAVVDAQGAKLYLEPAAMGALDHKVLDAEVEGDEVRFAIFDQADEGEELA